MKKCPFCELNYIKDDEKYCRICARDMHGLDDSSESVEMCIVCGEYPVQPGSELCTRCLREHKRIEDLSGNDTYNEEVAEDLLDEADEFKDMGMSIELTPNDNGDDDIPDAAEEDFADDEDREFERLDDADANRD